MLIIIIFRLSCRHAMIIFDVVTPTTIIHTSRRECLPQEEYHTARLRRAASMPLFSRAAASVFFFFFHHHHPPDSRLSDASID